MSQWTHHTSCPMAEQEPVSEPCHQWRTPARSASLHVLQFEGTTTAGFGEETVGEHRKVNQGSILILTPDICARRSNSLASHCDLFDVSHRLTLSSRWDTSRHRSSELRAFPLPVESCMLIFLWTLSLQQFFSLCLWVAPWYASPFRARNNAGGSLFNGFSSSFTGLTLGFMRYFVHLHITILLVTWPKTNHLIGVCTVSTLRSFHLSHFSEYIWLVLTLPSEQPHSVPVFFISCCCLPARKIALLCLQARSVQNLTNCG